MDNSERVRHTQEISGGQVKTIFKGTEKERIQSYKNVYKTNIQWGGGSKEHPGKKREQPLSVIPSSNQLARTHATTFGARSR